MARISKKKRPVKRAATPETPEKEEGIHEPEKSSEYLQKDTLHKPDTRDTLHKPGTRAKGSRWEIQYAQYLSKPPLPPKSEWGSSAKFASHKNGRPRCQAFALGSIRNGLRDEEAQCKRYAIPGDSYCRNHSFRRRKKIPKTVREEVKNRYKGHLPEHFLKRVIEAEQDPDKYRMEQEIDLITARATEILERIDSRQSNLAWGMVRSAYDVIRESIKSGDATGIRTGLSMLNDAINRSDYPTWHEFLSLIQQRKAFVEAERRYDLERLGAVTMQELLAVIMQIQEVIFTAVARTVSDKEVERKLKLELAESFRAMLAPDIMFMPGAQKERDKDLRRERKSVAERGCYICRHGFFRERNKDSDGWFTCPQCKERWAPDENGVEIQLLEAEVRAEEIRESIREESDESEE